MVSSALASARAARRLELVATGAGVTSRHGVDRRAPAVHTGDPLGWVAIPRIGIKTVIVEGDDDFTLSFAAGHVPGTTLPGMSGNAALAGHRDGVFRRLGQVRKGDLVVVTTPAATYRYAVESTHVVKPDCVRVLDAGSQATLTLITCFPFRYVGAAPERFIVRARLLPSHAPCPRWPNGSPRGPARLPTPAVRGMQV
jgi:sortase A